MITSPASQNCDKTCVCWPLLVLFKADQIIQVANLWTTHDSMEIYLCTNTCLNIQFRTQRYVGRFEI